MPQSPRLNNVIRVLEEGNVPLATFSPPSIESALALSTSAYDAVIFEMEHNPYDVTDLRHCLQYMLNRQQIFDRDTIAPAVTPMVRIPVNGAEMNQWLPKQVLDMGVFGIVFPHVSTVEQAYNAVASCRYARPSSAPLYEPQGHRGDQPGHAARYWGISTIDYYAKADVWPLNPEGEILVVMQVEHAKTIDNLADILKKVPGIGVVLIGEGDLSQSLGYPRQYGHPAVVEAMSAIRRICAEHNVVCGHPHAETTNAQKIVHDGYRFVMAAPTRSFAGLDACRRATGRI